VALSLLTKKKEKIPLETQKTRKEPGLWQLLKQIRSRDGNFTMEKKKDHWGSKKNILRGLRRR